MGPPPPQTPKLSSHFYSQALQLKLYQAFIFSVPVLFSIIVLLLFYLFYLKRRRDSILTFSPAPLLPLSNELRLKKELKEELPIIMFDEKMRIKESQCCVCLGDFELKEQLHQIPPCKHLFHIDCIQHWLEANFTCPLCRCTIVSTKKHNSETPIQLESLERNELDTNHAPHRNSNSDQELFEERNRASLSQSSCLNEDNSNQTEGSSSGRVCSTDYSLQGSVVIQTQMNTS